MGNSPQNPAVVILDIKRQNKENMHKFSNAQHTLANTVRTMAIAAHKTAKVYEPTYRKTEISVKVDGYRPTDKMTSEWDSIFKFCTDNNIVGHTKISRPNVFIYTISLQNI